MKQINPIFQTIGRRRKLIGFEALYDGFLVGVYDSRDRARFELDRYAYQEASTA